MAEQINIPLKMKGLGIARVVHYVLDNGEHRAAIVTKVNDPVHGVVNLNVQTAGPEDAEWTLDPDGAAWVEEHPADMPEVIRRVTVFYSEEPKPGTWHWPEPV